jgi:hypothetical protein
MNFYTNVNKSKPHVERQLNPNSLMSKKNHINCSYQASQKEPTRHVHTGRASFRVVSGKSFVQASMLGFKVLIVKLIDVSL